MVPFTNLPENIRVPLFYAEVDNSQANTAQINQRTLIIGQMTAAGAATPNIPRISAGIGDTQQQGGLNSMISAMLTAYRGADSFGETWILPLQDDPQAIAATGTVTITSAPTTTAQLSLYVGGKRYQLAVSPSQTTTQIATALANLINADAQALVKASAADNVVTLTAVNAGEVGNEIDLRLNYLGATAGEVTPLSMGVIIAPMTGGAGNPTNALAEALGNCGDQTFDFIVMPYTDTASLDLVKTFLDDQTGRWAWSQALYGHSFSALRGTLAQLTTAGNARNNQHETILGFNDSPTPAWIIAAQLVGSIAPAIRNDPGRPTQTLPILGMQAPPLPSRFILTERNTLLYDGISTFNVQDDGTCMVENTITTYQKNAFGDADDSYLQIETMYTLAYVLRVMRSMVTSRYPRMKLASDGTRFAAGSAIVTPSIIRGDLIAQFMELEDQGFVQNSDAFAKALIVERNATNPNRVDVLWPGTLINQLRIFAVLAQFRLS